MCLCTETGDCPELHDECQVQLDSCNALPMCAVLVSGMGTEEDYQQCFTDPLCFVAYSTFVSCYGFVCGDGVYYAVVAVVLVAAVIVVAGLIVFAVADVIVAVVVVAVVVVLVVAVVVVVVLVFASLVFVAVLLVVAVVPCVYTDVLYVY